MTKYPQAIMIAFKMIRDLGEYLISTLVFNMIITIPVIVASIESKDTRFF